MKSEPFFSGQRMSSWAWGVGVPLVMAVCCVFALRDVFGEAAARIHHAGWRIGWLVPYHALPLLLDAAGWWVLLRMRTSLPFLWWIAAVREGVSRLLPVASIGGEIVGVRLACKRLDDRPAVMASVIVEVLLTAIVQMVFALLGLALIWRTASALSIPDPVIATLLAGVPILLWCVASLGRGTLLQWLKRMAQRVFGDDRTSMHASAIDALDTALRAQVERQGALIFAFFAQLLGYAAGAFENWLAMRWLGVPVSPATAVSIEAVAQLARHVAFFVPMGVGVQDAAIVYAAGLLGVDAEAALSLALVKRMRETVFGVLSIVSWQASEWIGRVRERRDERAALTPER